MANVTEMPPPDAAENADTPPESAQSPATSTPPVPKKPGRPKNGTPSSPEPPFFARVAAVPKSDWGTRAFMYVYADEPICNPKTFGSTRYMLKSSSPILDLEALKQDYGSFKGWMTLNLRKTGKDQTDEIDRYEFEIYDPKHPPKIPRSAWQNDARNKKWLDLLPPEKPAPSEGAGTMLDAMRVYKEIRSDVRDEIKKPEEPQTRASEVLETMKAAKDLFGQPAPPASAPAKDPLEIAVALATTMMQMKADNPVIDMYRDELKALREEIKEERAAMRTAATTPPAAEKPKTLIEQLTDFKALKELFTTASGAVEGTVRAGRTTALDVARDLGSKFFESDLASGVGQYLASLATRNANGANPPLQMNGAQQQSVQRAPGNDFEVFITNVLNPALLRHYIQGFSGADFAGWLYDGYPDRVTQLQNFTHPMMPGLKGANAIIQAYKRTESMWPTLASRGEQEFVKFVAEFCAWKPVTDEAIDVEPGDSNAQQTEEGPERI